MIKLKNLLYFITIPLTTSIISGIKDSLPKFDSFNLVLDANWRWLHVQNGYKNCYDGSWICENDCDNCVLEGISLEQYKTVYGISELNNQIELQFITNNNIGSRLYVLKNDKYWFPDLLNKQISIDMDISEVPCSLNAAVYLVQVNSTEFDTLGIGYGDAQCPTDIKYFYNGKTNINKEPICSVEIDLIEANSEAIAWTLHPCNGNNCDKSGADANSYRQGYHNFYGPNKIIDTTKPITIITQFIGDPLTEVKRFYKQNNKYFEHPGGSLTSASIKKWKSLQNEPNTFEECGGFNSLTQAIKKGMAVIISLWDDQATNMKWLDSGDRGPCTANTNVRQTNPTAKVKFSNLILENIKHIIPTNTNTDTNTDTNTNTNTNTNTSTDTNTDTSINEFCCFASSDINKPCSTCYSSAKADSTTWCGKSSEICKTCGSTAVWCKDSSN